MSEIAKDYALQVVGTGDDASEAFKQAGKSGNKESLANILGLLDDSGNLVFAGNKTTKVAVQIDGVGTKTDIYISIFEILSEEYALANSERKTAIERECVDIWERMLSDLFAMNADDMRDGKICIAMTDIIDINKIHPKWGALFVASFSQAIRNVISQTGIALLAGETAILGDDRKVTEVKRLANRILEIALKVCEGVDSDELKALRGALEKTDEMMVLNAGGSATGLEVGETPKLTRAPEAGDVIIALSEIPTENGIIGPRSNGITAIRKAMAQMMGNNWHNKTFEDFCTSIGSEKTSRIPEKVKKDCAGLKLWDIATGKTTVFNPFVAGELLGGVYGDPIADISSIIHVTGNPGRKIKEGLGANKDTVSVQIDLEKADIQIPHIIALLQAGYGFTDEEALKMWNMGIPYAVVVAEKDAQKVLGSCAKFGYNAKIVGTINKKEDGVEDTISGVGLGKSTVTITA